MRRRLLILFFSLILFSVDVCATEYYRFNYTIGEKIYELFVGEYAEYQFYLPFDSASIEIQYSCTENIALDIIINNNKISQNLECGSTSTSIYLEEVLHKGDCDLEIINGKSAVKSISFHKISEPTSYSGPEGITEEDRNVVDFTDYEEAVRTAVIINKNSPVIKVNGADRYVNYDNPKETPYCENSVTYLPIHTFSRAFGYYYEQDDNYFLLRTDNVEFVFTNGRLYRQAALGEYSEIDNNTLQKEGEIYIPVEFYAKECGKTVLVKDDYIIADQRELAKKIVNDEVFECVKEEFSNFISQKTQTIYYVAQTDYASDKNPGTAEAPFATLSKACEVADAGDKVIINTGTYREILKPLNDGTADNPIIFEAAEGADVTISALENMYAPDYVEDGLYVYNIDWDLGEGRNQVFYKNAALAEARHPNSHSSPRYYPEQLNLCELWPTQGDIQVTLDGVADTATSNSDLNQPDDFWKDGTLVTLHGNGYGVATAKITSSEKGKLYLGKKSTRLWHKEEGSNSDYHYDFAYITDSLNAVDAAGEWYWGEGKLYVYPPEGETDKELFNLEVKRRQLTVDLTDRKYIHLVGINTIGSGMKLNNSVMCVVNGGDHKYIAHHTYTDDTETGFIDTRDQIEDLYGDCAVYRGEVGFYLGGRNNAVINARIEYSASGALCLAGAYSYIENNFISECGYMGGGTNGIYIFSSPLEDITIVKGGHSLYNNTVDKTGRASLNLSSWTFPLDGQRGLVPWIACEIAYNDFLNANICTRDSGAVYAYGSILGDERKKLQFHHNIIGSSWASDSYNVGIYWDNFSQMVECYNNIIFYEDKKIGEDSSYLHIADFSKYPDAFSYINAWNNVNAGFSFLGKAGLSINDYPLRKWFSTGCSLKNENNFNTEIVINNEMYSINENSVSTGVTLDINGAAHLNKADEWIQFNDVNFGNNCGYIGLVYCGDRYNTGDRVVIEIEDKVIEAVLECSAANKTNVSELLIPIDSISATADILIKCSEYKSAGILGINVIPYENAVNNIYSLCVTDDDNKYYLSGKGDKNISVIGTITDKDGKIIHSLDAVDTNETGEFNLSLNKTKLNGVYQMNIFSWDSLETLKPLIPAERYIYAENKFKNPFSIIKFKDAEEYPALISDGTVVSSYGNNDRILIKNVDFRNGVPKELSVKYGIDESECGKLTVKVYLDNTQTNPILTFTPENTSGRTNRLSFVYDLENTELITGVHDLYFVIEGQSTYPIHLENLKFEGQTN